MKITTASEAIQLLADEAARRGATASDEFQIVRCLVQEALPGRPDAQFSAWLCVCCELADRAARREGFENQVHRALTMARAAIAAKQSNVGLEGAAS